MLFYSKTKNVHQKTTPINITAYVTSPYILVNMELYFCNVNMVKIDFFYGWKKHKILRKSTKHHLSFKDNIVGQNESHPCV